MKKTELDSEYKRQICRKYSVWQTLTDLIVPKILQQLSNPVQDWIVRHGEGEWEWCVQRKCNNPNCPYPMQSWWNAFLYNPNKPDKHIQLMQEYYVTDNNKNHYASSIKPKIHRCMKTNPPGKWVNKEDNNINFWRDNIVQDRDNNFVKQLKIDRYNKLTAGLVKQKDLSYIKEWEAFSFEYQEMSDYFLIEFLDAGQKFARVIMSMRKGELPEDSVIDGINYFIDTLFFLTKQQQYIDKVKSVE